VLHYHHQARQQAGVCSTDGDHGEHMRERERERESRGQCALARDRQEKARQGAARLHKAAGRHSLKLRFFKRAKRGLRYCEVSLNRMSAW
jgi:hypothetical protein